MFVCGYSVRVGSGNSPVVVTRLPGGQSYCMNPGKGFIFSPNYPDQLWGLPTIHLSGY
jgi:hypothetical protein